MDSRLASQPQQLMPTSRRKDLAQSLFLWRRPYVTVPGDTMQGGAPLLPTSIRLLHVTSCFLESLQAVRCAFLFPRLQNSVQKRLRGLR